MTEAYPPWPPGQVGSAAAADIPLCFKFGAFGKRRVKAPLRPRRRGLVDVAAYLCGSEVDRSTSPVYCCSTDERSGSRRIESNRSNQVVLATPLQRRSQVKLSVLLADDHTILRHGVRSLIHATEHIEVIGEAADGLEALRLAELLQPDVVVIDIAMPNMNGIDALRHIVALRSRPRVIVLSVHGEREYVCAALRAGASGYLMKDAAFSDLLAAIEAVAKGRRYLPAGLSDLALSGLLLRANEVVPQVPETGIERLSLREREVLGLLARSHTNDEIGGRLHISSHTVQAHRKRIMEKLGIHRAVELARFALRNGLAEFDE